MGSGTGGRAGGSSTTSTADGVGFVTGRSSGAGGSATTGGSAGASKIESSASGGPGRSEPSGADPVNVGIGPGVSPKTALSVGLKVDADALPEALKTEIAAGKVDLDDPATTIALLKLNAVVGVTAFANSDGSVKSMGIQCALVTPQSMTRLRRD